MTREVLWWLGSPGPPYPLLLLMTFSASAMYVDHRGTSFILTYIENRYLVDEPIPKIFLVAATNETAMVKISVPLESYFDKVLTVNPGTGIEHSFPYDIHMVDDGYNFKAVYIESDKPIVVEAASLNDHSSDAFLILPIRSLGTYYIVLSYVFAGSSQQQQGPSSVGITAVEDATTVQLEIPDVEELDTSTGAFRDLLEGNVMEISLNKYQSFHIRSKYAHDLTGVKITSNLPLSVVAGSKWTSVGKELMGDHLVENLPPVNTWGTTFYTVPVANRTAGDVIRVLGYTPETKLRVLSTVEGTSKVNDYQLNEMGFLDIENPSNTTLMIMSNKRVLVGQFCKSHSSDDNRNSDPFMMLLPPRSQYTNEYHFMTVSTRSGSSYNNYLSIVSETEQRNALILNNMIINKEDLEWGWVQVASSSMSAAILVLQNGTYHLRHKNPDVVFGAQLYGLKFQESYGLPLGQKYRALTYKEICLSLSQEKEDFFDNDCDGLFDEEILNGIDDDGDGLIDEDVFNEHRSRPQNGSLLDMAVPTAITDMISSGNDGHLFLETTSGGQQDTSSIVVTSEADAPTTKLDMESSSVMLSTIEDFPSTSQTTTVRTKETITAGGIAKAPAVGNKAPSTEVFLSATEESIQTTKGLTRMASTLFEATSEENSPTTMNPVTTSTIGPTTTESRNDPETTMAFIPTTSEAITSMTSFSELSTSTLRETSSSAERNAVPSTESRLESTSSVSTITEGPLKTEARSTESKPSPALPTPFLVQIMTSTYSQRVWNQGIETTGETMTTTMPTSTREETTVIESEATSASHTTIKLTPSTSITDTPETITIDTDPIMVIIPLAILFGLPLIFITSVILKAFIAAKRQNNARKVQPIPQPRPDQPTASKPVSVVALKSKTYQAPVFDARNN